jgi:TPR repeat protein
MYFQGLGVQRDEAAAERWYEAGAKLHDPRAQFQLANLLWHRQSETGNLKRAAKLMRESAAAGLVAAKHQLAILLVKNPELAASPQEVPTLLKEAAEAGEWRSSVALGLLSRDGMGVPVDSKAAYYHYRVAALQGGDDALRVVARDLDAISTRLGQEQAAAIDSEAEAFAANHRVALQFVNKDGARWKEYPTYAVVNPDQGAYAGRVIPTESSDFLKSPPDGKLSTH